VAFFQHISEHRVVVTHCVFLLEDEVHQMEIYSIFLIFYYGFAFLLKVICSFFLKVFLVTATY
jgi:hypothetical protein